MFVDPVPPGSYNGREGPRNVIMVLSTKLLGRTHVALVVLYDRKLEQPCRKLYEWD